MSKQKVEGGPGKTVYPVTPEQFVATWEAATSAQEVADKLKMPKDIVHARASMYRGLGIKLKKMPRHRNAALDVAKLNAIIAEVDRRKGTPPQAKAAKKPLPVAEDDVLSIVERVLKG